MLELKDSEQLSLLELLHYCCGCQDHSLFSQNSKKPGQETSLYLIMRPRPQQEIYFKEVKYLQTMLPQLLMSFGHVYT